MKSKSFDFTDLARILTEAAGGEELDLADVLDTEFDGLGYDSLAMLETAARIEREFGVMLGDSSFTDAMTPRSLIKLVNSCLSLPEAS